MLKVYTRRGLSTLKHVQSCQEYLDYCHHKGTPFTSTVFKGTLYELTAKALLEKSLNFFGLVRSGGANDNGLDLYGRWDLSQFKEMKSKPPKKVLSTSLLLLCKPFSTRKSALDLLQDVVVLVQCKNHRSKIKAATVRELAGIREFHINMSSKIDRRRTFMVLVSPLPMTKQAQIQMDTSDVPMLHAQVMPLEPPVDVGPGDYRLETWEGGVLGPIYLNFTARTLLLGLTVERKLSEVVR